MMYNWNINTTNWDKNSDSYRIWHLEQMINFGLNNEKLDLEQVKKYWSQLDLDPERKSFLELIIWHPRS